MAGSTKSGKTGTCADAAAEFVEVDVPACVLGGVRLEGDVDVKVFHRAAVDGLLHGAHVPHWQPSHGVSQYSRRPP